MKIRHILKGNKETELPHEFVFVDTETYSVKLDNCITAHPLKLGSAVYVQIDENKNHINEDWITFRRNEEFFDWLNSKIRPKTKLYIYAHNMHFDFLVLNPLEYLKSMGWKLGKWFIDSQVFVMEFKKSNKKLVFLDSGNIIKCKLEKLGEKLGIKKLEIDFNKCSMKELERYCKRDVEILKRFILSWREFIKKHDLGRYQYTLASQALSAFKHRFNNKIIEIHNNKYVIKLERESYRGGRNECFFIGEKKGEKFYLLDVNSMYPYVMKTYEYPVELVDWGFRDIKSKLKAYLNKYCVIAKAHVTVDKPCVGIKRERLIFPVGSFIGTFTTEELKYLLENAIINRIFAYSLYRKENIFSNYIDFFYDLKCKYKQEGNKIDYEITKLFLNSLYGKFGQKNTKFKLVEEEDDDLSMIEDIYDSENKKRIVRVHLAGKIFEKDKEVEGFDSFVAIASEVTANARMYLWHFIEKAGLNNVFYCDTDSLLVNEQGYNNLKNYIDDKELGKLEVQLETDHIIIRGCKDYQFGSKIKIKGVKDTAIQVKPNKFKQTQFLKFRSALRKGVGLGALTREVVKELRREYKKGKVNKSGYVEPFRLNEDIYSFT